MKFDRKNIKLPIKDIERVWDILENFDIRLISIQIENINPEVQVGLILGESETIHMGEPFKYMFSPPYNRFIDNINRVMMFYPKAIKEFDINATPVDLCIIYQKQAFIIFLINSLEVYLSKTFKKITNILRIDHPDSDYIMQFIEKYGSISKYNKYYSEEREPTFVSEFLTKRLYFQQKDTTRDCFKFVYIDLPELAPRLWQKIFSKRDSYMQLRHKIIHGDRPSLNDIEEKYTIENIEIILFDIVQFVYLIEEQRFLKYPCEEEELDFIQRFKEIEMGKSNMDKK